MRYFVTPMGVGEVALHKLIIMGTTTIICCRSGGSGFYVSCVSSLQMWDHDACVENEVLA